MDLLLSNYYENRVHKQYLKLLLIMLLSKNATNGPFFGLLYEI